MDAEVKKLIGLNSEEMKLKFSLLKGEISSVRTEMNSRFDSLHQMMQKLLAK
jgi:hypothetical protein